MKTLDSYVVTPNAKGTPGRPKMHAVPSELREALPAVVWTRSGESQHGHMIVTWWQTQDGGMTVLRGLWAGGRAEWQLRMTGPDGDMRGTGLTPDDAWVRKVWVEADGTPSFPELPTDEQLDDPAQHLARFEESCRNFRLNFPQYQMEAEQALPGCRLCAVAEHFVRWEHAGMGIELYVFPGPVWAATRYTGESGDHEHAADAISEAVDLHAQSLMQRSA